jgi:hypothetical protein
MSYTPHTTLLLHILAKDLLLIIPNIILLILKEQMHKNNKTFTFLDVISLETNTLFTTYVKAAQSCERRKWSCTSLLL